MAKDSEKWWQTLPVMITAIAGTITAIAGLVAALNQAGIFPTKAESNSQSTAPSVVTETPTPSPPSLAQPAAETPAAQSGANHQPSAVNPAVTTLTSGMAASLPFEGGGSVTYTILSAQLEPFNQETQSLKLTVRCTSNYPYDLNFWSRSFRLLVEGVPQSPNNDLNELVSAQSAKEGEITFIVPASTRQAILDIGEPGKETTQIPLDLTATSP
ncbi:MAG: hypothetical protein HC800_01690 [Phormidesmis sp. RL_2_1]|nr:hypothetical protein [Phormidesmis sp. RL_2_1]